MYNSRIPGFTACESLSDSEGFRERVFIQSSGVAGQRAIPQWNAGGAGGGSIGSLGWPSWCEAESYGRAGLCLWRSIFRVDPVSSALDCLSDMYSDLLNCEFRGRGIIFT